MGVLDFDYDKGILKRIKQTLSRRGLKPDLKEEWEVHGPHGPDMNYQVYIGYAYPKDEKELCRWGCGKFWRRCKKHIQEYCVAIYPKAVYKIDDPSKWYQACPENRILIENKILGKG